MKKLLTILGITSALLCIKLSNVYAQHPPPCTTCGPGVPVHTDPSTYRGGLVSLSYNPSDYPAGTVVGEMKMYESNGPSLSTSIGAFGVPAGGASQGPVNLETLFPGFLTGGKYNDRIRALTFTGTLIGRDYKFYDSPSESTSDDWTEVYFVKNPPAGYGYFLWTLEANYADDYVYVIYHHVNGLDGKVSSFQSNIQ